MVFPGNIYQIYQDHILFILSLIFMLTYSIELIVIYPFFRKKFILNFKEFLLYVLFINLITFPITHFIIFLSGI